MFSSRDKNVFNPKKEKPTGRPAQSDIAKIHHIKDDRKPILTGLCDKSSSNNMDMFRK